MGQGSREGRADVFRGAAFTRNIGINLSIKRQYATAISRIELFFFFSRYIRATGGSRRKGAPFSPVLLAEAGEMRSNLRESKSQRARSTVPNIRITSINVGKGTAAAAEVPLDLLRNPEEPEDSSDGVIPVGRSSV